jgi:DNA polymerase elongation subunit (family B)
MVLPLYGFDIESTSLSPLEGRTRSIASWGDFGHFYAEAVGAEGELGLIIGALSWLKAQPSGIVVGWNTSGFDVPFLLTRARALHAHVRQGQLLCATAATDRPLKYEPTPGHVGGYRVQSFGGHKHCDIMNPWKVWADENGVEWSLKPVASAVGLDPIKEDREAMEDLTSERLCAYNLSDARVTKGLGELLSGAEFDAWID